MKWLAGLWVVCVVVAWLWLSGTAAAAWQMVVANDAARLALQAVCIGSLLLGALLFGLALMAWLSPGKAAGK